LLESRVAPLTGHTDDIFRSIVAMRILRARSALNWSAAASSNRRIVQPQRPRLCVVSSLDGSASTIAFFLAHASGVVDHLLEHQVAAKHANGLLPIIRTGLVQFRRSPTVRPLGFEPGDFALQFSDAFSNACLHIWSMTGN